MPLAALAMTAINVPGVPILCHTATWFWAAQEAQLLGLTPAKAPKVTMDRIAGIDGGAQNAILDLATRGKAGHWDFALPHMQNGPPVGSVLLWTANPTHSATVAQNRQIASYNQSVVFPPLVGNVGFASRPAADLSPGMRRCRVIAEQTIVAQAGALGL